MPGQPVLHPGTLLLLLRPGVEVDVEAGDVCVAFEHVEEADVRVPDLARGRGVNQREKPRA